MTDLEGEKCCILGLGSIGEAVSKRARAFGMSVHGIKRTTSGYDGSAGVIYSPEDSSEALRDARLFVIAVPQTPETEGMVAREELEALANDAIVVNVARGPILVTEALVSALDDGQIAAACLDVTDPEPLPAEHPLWDRDDVLITPHCAGASRKYPERFCKLFEEQYERWATDRELHYRIN